MAQSFSCTPSTAAEKQTFAQCSALDRLFASPVSNGTIAYGMSCQVSTIDAFSSVLNEDFELDRPMALALAAQLVSTQPEQAVLLLAATVPPDKRPTDDRFVEALGDTLIGGGNLPGNVAGSTEAALRAHWKKGALKAFKSLTSGAQTSTIRLGPHITIEPRNIGKGGDLRKGARLMVRVRGLPMTVVHSLPSPLISKAGGQFGAVRVGARDLQRMTQVGDALADARVKSVGALKFASGRFGGGVLAFGPSAAIDLYHSANWNDGSMSMDWRGFGVRSAKSQSGNLVGFAAGAGAAAGAVALGLVAAVGWPVVLVGLGAGLVAQVAWSSAGFDEDMENLAKSKLGR